MKMTTSSGVGIFYPTVVQDFLSLADKIVVGHASTTVLNYKVGK